MDEILKAIGQHGHTLTVFEWAQLAIVVSNRLHEALNQKIMKEATTAPGEGLAE